MHRKTSAAGNFFERDIKPGSRLNRKLAKPSEQAGLEPIWQVIQLAEVDDIKGATGFNNLYGLIQGAAPGRDHR